MSSHQIWIGSTDTYPILELYFINNQINSHNFTKNSDNDAILETPFGRIPLMKIIEVISENGNKKYTFLIRYFSGMMRQRWPKGLILKDCLILETVGLKFA